MTDLEMLPFSKQNVFSLRRVCSVATLQNEVTLSKSFRQMRAKFRCLEKNKHSMSAETSLSINMLTFTCVLTQFLNFNNFHKLDL